MHYRTPGQTGVQVSTLVLGAMTFGATGRTTQDEADAIVAAAIEAGVNLIDTADSYGRGQSEEMVGTAIAGRRDDVLIATNRAAAVPQRFDLTVAANRVRLDAVELLVKLADEAGLTLIQLALGFVTAHPGVTSAIIGPRTLEHLRSQLAAADTVLPGDVLDTVDTIVAPGLDLAPEEKIDTPPSLLDATPRRRRS